jgi:hypothetical protein
MRAGKKDTEKRACPEGDYILDAYHHEQAEVAAGECIIFVEDEEAFRKKLEKKMEALAAWVNGQGGIIGHIKAGVDYTHTDMLSITDTELQRKSGSGIRIHCHLAAIVFCVELEELQQQVGDILQEFCRKK